MYTNAKGCNPSLFQLVTPLPSLFESLFSAASDKTSSYLQFILFQPLGMWES